MIKVVLDIETATRSTKSLMKYEYKAAEILIVMLDEKKLSGCDSVSYI